LGFAAVMPGVVTGVRGGGKAGRAARTGRIAHAKRHFIVPSNCSRASPRTSRRLDRILPSLEERRLDLAIAPIRRMFVAVAAEFFKRAVGSAKCAPIVSDEPLVLGFLLRFAREPFGLCVRCYGPRPSGRIVRFEPLRVRLACILPPDETAARALRRRETIRRPPAARAHARMIVVPAIARLPKVLLRVFINRPLGDAGKARDLTHGDCAVFVQTAHARHEIGVFRLPCAIGGLGKPLFLGDAQ
jgi:hypothetical protein